MKTKICENCGSSYETNARNSKYCSEECKKEAANKKRRKKQNFKQCKYCKKFFMPKKETQNFCCKECRRKYFDSQKRVRQYKTWCAQCGKEIIVSRNPTQKEPLRFCCKKCGDKYRMEHEEKRICPTCGKSFVPYRSNHIFCSRICRDIDTLRKVGNGKFKEAFI